MHIFTQEPEEYREYEWNRLPELVPSMVFKTRVRDESLEGSNPYRWQDVNSYEIFGNKKVLLFSLPGAFTPTCDTWQLPRFEELASHFYAQGIDDIYCISVNDSFVMNKWAQSQNLRHVKVLPDGSAAFTRSMQMVVDKDNLGFGERSWRYAVVVDNGTITHWFLEHGKEDNCEEDPYEYTNPEFILDML